jgi:hypothetical protein
MVQSKNLMQKIKKKISCYIVTKREGPYASALDDRAPDADLSDLDLLIQTQISYTRMISKPKLLILSTTFERSVPHHNTPLQKQGFTQLKHTELIYEAFLVLNCKICTFQEHKLSLKPSPKTLRFL